MGIYEACKKCGKLTDIERDNCEYCGNSLKPQNLPKADAYSLLDEVRAGLQEQIDINTANTEVAMGLRQGLYLAIYLIDRKVSEHFS